MLSLLLSLGADQMIKGMIKTCDDLTKAISTFYLHEPQNADLNELLILLFAVNPDTTTILYQSPQFLVNCCPSFINDLLKLGVL